MDPKKIALLFAALISGFFSASSYAGEEKMLHFLKEDRLLVIAPHPDDETLAAAGTIQAAVEAGAQVRVLYLTHGESNEISALFYQKKPLILKSDFLKIGNIRRSEAVQAMALLGLKIEQFYFLGYPDLGTMPIWEKHWEGARPFRSFFTRINKVVYEDDFSYGKYYKGYNIVHDLEKILSEYKPTIILSSAPFDLNLDHQAAYLFLNVALLNLESDLQPPPKVYLYLIHSKFWKKNNRFEPESVLEPPPVAGFESLHWTRVFLSPAQLGKKEEAVRLYKSQLSYSREFLLSFVRKNEIFAEYPYEKIQADPGLDAEMVVGSPTPSGGDVVYKMSSSELFIDLPLMYPVDEMGAVTLELFGYKKGIPFSVMPKLNFRLFGNKMFVKNGLYSFFDKGILYRIEKGRLLVRISLKTLKDPELLFVTTRTAKDELSLDFGSWRVLVLDQSR